MKPVAAAFPTPCLLALFALEHADLRELQDTITNKTLWERFEPYFRNKEQLVVRFSQLAELRNTIRHSRSLTNVVRKEGEASIEWFAGILPSVDVGRR